MLNKIIKNIKLDNNEICKFRKEKIYIKILIINNIKSVLL